MHGNLGPHPLQVSRDRPHLPKWKHAERCKSIFGISTLRKPWPPGEKGTLVARVGSDSLSCLQSTSSHCQAPEGRCKGGGWHCWGHCWLYETSLWWRHGYLSGRSYRNPMAALRKWGRFSLWSWQTPHRFSPSRAGASRSSECQLGIALGASLLGQQGMARNLAGYTGSRQQKPRGKTVNSCKLVSAMRRTKNCNDYVIYVLGYLKKNA